MKRLKNLTIILDQPQGAGNIGAVARAMKNMALSNLTLVKPAPFLNNEGLRMAMGSQEILQKAKVVDRFEEALEGFHLVIGTSRRKGRIRKPLMMPREAAKHIAESLSKNKVALVFGSEKDGLDNKKLFQCHLISTIPASPKQPSFNLAQAVMIYCYEMYLALLDPSQSPLNGAWEKFRTHQMADQKTREKMFETVDVSLARIGFYEHGNPKRLMQSVRQLFGKANLTHREVRIIRGIFGQVQRALDVELPGDLP